MFYFLEVLHMITQAHFAYRLDSALLTDWLTYLLKARSLCFRHSRPWRYIV